MVTVATVPVSVYTSHRTRHMANSHWHTNPADHHLGMPIWRNALNYLPQGVLRLWWGTWVAT